MSDDTSRSLSRFALSLGLLLVSLGGLFAPATVRAQDEAPREHGFYAHVTLQGGYRHYWQRYYADREIGGGALVVTGAVGYTLAPAIVLGTTVAFDTMMPATGSRASGSALVSDACFGGRWGLLFAWLPEPEEVPLALEIGAGIGGAGDPGKWGGGGPFLSAALTVYFAHAGRSHFGATAEVLYQPMFSDDATPRGADKQFVLATIGVGWTFY